MAVTISNSRFSFVNFNEEDENFCPNEAKSCLPLYELGDLVFQLKATVTGADKAAFNNTFFWRVGFYNGAALIEITYPGTWTKIETGTGSDPDIWIGNFTHNTSHSIFDSLEVGECFALNLVKTNADSSIKALLGEFTTCFKKIADTCYTSVMLYRANNDAFDFYYSDFVNFANSVRLSFYLHSPFKTEEENSYEKSNGATVTLSYRLWQDYKFKTDYWTVEIHNCFAIALAHNTIVITCTYANMVDGFFVRKEKIDIDWHEDDNPQFKAAQATGTLRLAAPMANVNSNCSG